MSINPRILGAIGVGAVLIAFAYFTAPKQETTLTNDPYTVEAKRAFIPVGDIDNDGIPDWSESFRQAEVPEIDREALVGEGGVYTPPETLTGQLAISLFSGMVEGGARGPLGPSQEDILNSADRQMRDAATDDLYTLDDLTITGNNDPEILHAYGNQVAEIMLLEPLPEGTRNEVEVIQHAVYSNDSDALRELDPTIQSYKNIRDKLVSLPVPSTVAQEHLNLTNALHAIYIDTEGMRQVFDDPIYTIVRMQRYYDDLLGMNNATVQIYKKLDSSGVSWSRDDIAFALISLTIQ